MILALTAQHDAPTALAQALARIPGTALYADLSTSAPAVKRSLAASCADNGLAFVDVAPMSPVPGKGLRTPALASGIGAKRYVATFARLGSAVSSVGDQAGEAATRKLLRSVMMKGLAALVIEAMRAAEKLDRAEWLWDNLVDEISRADELLLRRLVEGTSPHALRRLHEMQASQALLESVGVEPLMTSSTVASLAAVVAGKSTPRLPTLG